MMDAERGMIDPQFRRQLMGDDDPITGHPAYRALPQTIKSILTSAK
jgi:hypothetical protein